MLWRGYSIAAVCLCVSICLVNSTEDKAIIVESSNLPINVPIGLYLLTWNVGGRKPPSDLTSLLDLSNPQSPDIYGIGLQEVGNGHYEYAENSIWTKAFTTVLGKRGYVRLKIRRMQGLLTLVYVRRKDLLSYTNIESEFTRAGWGGWWGNKGGVSVRFDVNGVNMIFVNCHLAAHQNNIAERLEDYDTILATQFFKDDDTDNILDHDMVFWMGDLNFRVDGFTRKEVESYITKKAYDPLLERDQLLNCMKEELILVNFQEGHIKFPPTYKFDKGTDLYDTSQLKRVPAWCDRILWNVDEAAFTNVDITVEQTHYTSITEYTDSDHKPVVATFDLQVFAHPISLATVTFCLPCKLYINQDNEIQYKMSKNTKHTSSSWDWIGLYKEDFTHLRKYEGYTYAKADAEDSKDGVTLTLTRSMMAVLPGNYYLCYISKYKDTLLGMSQLIKLEP